MLGEGGSLGGGERGMGRSRKVGDMGVITPRADVTIERPGCWEVTRSSPGLGFSEDDWLVCFSKEPQN